jgi:hypothetical protein
MWLLLSFNNMVCFIVTVASENCEACSRYFMVIMNYLTKPLDSVIAICDSLWDRGCPYSNSWRLSALQFDLHREHIQKLASC